MLLASIGLVPPAFGQDDTRPAFQLSSSQVYSSRERPSIYLTFQRVTTLDFRVYRVQDALAFFGGLKDPHVLGSPEPVVPQEQTWLERLANWKARQRYALRDFLRGQVSHDYRQQRRAAADSAAVVDRRAVNYQTFAQVPLLNKAQLVASWRELLPNVRDAEVRRIPLELPGRGAFVVEAVNGPLKAYTIVIVSDVGLVTKTSPTQLVTYVADRFSGEPKAGCEIAGLADQKPVARGQTGTDGVFLSALDPASADDFIAVAKCGDEVVASDAASWMLRPTARELLGYVYSDRPVYRPGHTVNIKAVLRWRDRGLVQPFDRRTVEVAVSDPDEKVIARQSLAVDEFGSVAMSVALPRTSALGYYGIAVRSEEDTATGSFEVQEYRKPEFEVGVTAGERFILQGGQAKVTVRARYYFGQPVAGATVKYVVFKGRYFSPWRWVESAGEGDAPEDSWYAGDQISEATTTLDARGEATVSIPVPEDEDDFDETLKIEARVTDTSGREVSGLTNVQGIVGRFLLAASVDRYVHRPGDRTTVRVRAVNYQGAPQAGIAVTALLNRITYPEGRYDEPDVTEIANARITTDAEGRASWTVTLPADSGTYRVQLSAESGERTIAATADLYVPGPESSFGDDAERSLEMVADRGTYQPGDTARLMIRGEDVTGPVFVTKERELTSWHRVVRVTPSDALEVPIEPDDIGDVYVSIAFLKDDRLYRAERRLSVPATSRAVSVTVDTSAPVSKPKEPGVFTIRAVDASGRPVRAQLTVAVVDEALYGVKPDATPDPVRFFYRRDYSKVSTQFSREYSFVGYSGTQQLLLAQRRRPFTLAEFKADRPERPEVRRDFPDAIYWSGALTTDGNGLATVQVRYPDALTTWRLTARAATVDTRVGGAVARTTVTKDVIVRPIVPRFLTEGDLLRLPVIAHNYLPGAGAFTVTAGAKGLSAAESTSSAPVTGEIPAGGEMRTTWPFVASTAGTATISTSAATTVDEDRVELSFPVKPYGLAREEGRSGSLRDDGSQTVSVTIPERSNPAARTISIAMTPTLAGSLLGALDWLTGYPYGCTEQTVSSFLPNLVVTRTLAELKLAPTERVAIADRFATAGVRRVLDLQREDGGFGWWKTSEPDPFMTAYALYGLLQAERAGLKVESWKIGNAATAAARLYAAYPQAVPELKAYLAYTIALAIEANHAPELPEETWTRARAFDELWEARDRMSPYGRALFVLALDTAKDGRSSAIADALLRAARTKGDLSWWTAESDPLLEEHVDASVEATAFAVTALAHHAPGDPTLERAIRWLLVNRTGSFWYSTKQTAMALYALGEFLRTRKEAPSTFSVDVSVNGEPAGTHQFTPEAWTSAAPFTLTVPGRTGANEVTVTRRGSGAVYWTVTARYLDNAESQAPEGTRTLALARTYSKLTPVTKNGRIVYRETPFDGNAAPGDLLYARITTAGAKDWRYLVVDDPIPAGCEAVARPELFELEKPDPWWFGAQREYRDDRVVTFLEDFARGRYDFGYLLRAVTPGVFRAMPAQIAPMYVPGVSASSTAQAVTVGPLAEPASRGGSR